MRKLDLAIECDRSALAESRRRRGPLADAVHCQDCRFREGGWIERTCGVALVVLCEKQAIGPLHAGCILIQFANKKLAEKQLLLEPQWHGFREGRISARREGKIGFDQALELDEGLLVKNHVIALIERDAALREA